MSSKPVTLLTGAAHGIGRATAIALVERGIPVGLIDRDAPALEELAQTLRSSSATPVAAAAVDVTARENLFAAVNQLASELGPFEVLVACAGVGALTLVPELDTFNLRQTLEVNVVGVAHSIEAVLPRMIERRHGHIVGIASMAGYRGFPWMISYSASKAGLIAYLEAMRPGLRRRGVTVTTVCPGFVRTKMCTDLPYQRPIKMIEPEVAARHLVRAVERRPRNCVFPLSMRFGLAVLKYMPDWFFDWMMRLAGPKALHVEF
jgi:3-oxoacyl-[acyl-carrier protein] reductase